MAAHRYWRLVMSSDNGNSRAALRELEMRTTVGGATACTGGTPIASGDSSSMVIARAFDGNTSTEWQSQIASLAWAGYDFGSAVDIVEMAATLGANSSMLSPWVRVEYSDNGSAWQMLAPYFNTAAAVASSTVVLGGFAAVAAPRLVGAVSHLATAWPAGPLRHRLTGLACRVDAEDGGTLRIAGDVGIDGATVTLVRRRVRLFHRQSGRLVRETWSDTGTGAFEFRNLKAQDYLVVSDDHTRYYNAVIADAVVPVP